MWRDLSNEEWGCFLVPALIREYGADIVAPQEANYYPDNAHRPRSCSACLADYLYVHVYRSQSFASKFATRRKEKIRYESAMARMLPLEAPNGKKILVASQLYGVLYLAESEREEYKGYSKRFKASDLSALTWRVKEDCVPNLNQRAFAAECALR